MLTSIILPIHNQADHLREIVAGHREALARRGSPFEILLVNNACSDDSPAISEALASSHGEVRMLEIEEGGWGRAVLTGLAAARGERLCYSNSARTTPEMLNLVLIYSDAYPEVVVKANRRVRDNWLRRAGSLLYNLECRALFDLPVWDINGTPKVFPRAFSRLLELQRLDDLIDVEFISTCKRERYPIVEVPLLATHRHGGRSTTSYRSGARMYWGAYQLHRQVSRAV